MLLSELKIGQHATIKSIRPGDRLYRNRLISLGLIPGTSVVLSRVAPLGDPIQILVRGFLLSLRKAEANILVVETKV